MVWAMKEAVQDETRGLKGHEYFKYIRVHTKQFNLPVASSRRRAACGAKSGN